MQPLCNRCNGKGLKGSRKYVKEVWKEGKEKKMKGFEAFGILIRKPSSEGITGCL
jgi:hypothetical protein